MRVMRPEPTSQRQEGFLAGKSVIRSVNENRKTRTALLLAAGIGCRLRPITDDAPKCLTEIGGVSILERLVRCLQLNGINKLVVVVGHMQESIRNFFEESSIDMNVEFVFNPDYRTTNNILSLWLARESLREPFLLVESDLVFDSSLLAPMLFPNKIAVSPIENWMNGSTVTLDRNGRVNAFHSKVKPERSMGFPPLKTVNMYSLSLSSWKQVEKRLELYISSGRVHDYYEVVFSEMVREGALWFEAVTFDPRKWYEVDTLLDLDEAERRFPSSLGSISSQLPALP